MYIAGVVLPYVCYVRSTVPPQAQDTEHETLARAIFDELNDAYTRFEESGARPLY